MHKNINFWSRLLVNFIDFIIFVGIVVLNYYFLFNASKTVILVNYYYFLTSTLLLCLILYFIIPLTLNGRTLGMLITRIQLLSKSKSIAKIALKKSLFSVFYLLLIIFVITTLVMPWEVNQFKENIAKNVNVNNRLKVTRTLIETLSSVWLIIITLNYASSIISRKNLSLIDNWSETRMVYQKHYKTNENNKNIKLIPFKTINAEVIIMGKGGTNHE